MLYWLQFTAGALLACAVLLWPLGRRFARAWRPPWQLRRPLRPHVTIDGQLLVAPPAMAEARLPFDAAPAPRMRPGALLWASAATVTHTLAAPEHRGAILAAVQPLGFTPGSFLARCPILGEAEVHGQRGYVVQDGHGYRAYFLGDPAALLSACADVWETHPRPVTDEDRALLPPSRPGQYGLATAPAGSEGIGPLTYLGSLLIDRGLQNTAAAELLGRQGLAIHIDTHAVPEHAPALQAYSTAAPDARTLYVGTVPSQGNSFVPEDPLSPAWAGQIAAGFAQAHRQRQHLLRTLLLLGCFAIAAAIWALPGWWLPLCALLLLPRVLQCSMARPAPLRLAALLLWAMAMPWMLQAFLQYAAPAAAPLALPLALLACAGCTGFHPPAWLMLPAALLPALAWVLLQPPLLPGLFCLLAGCLHGVILRLIAKKCS